jgi:hypothetical protein
MIKKIKKILKKIYRATKDSPIIGHFVRIGGALIKLPEYKQRQLLFEEQQIPVILRSISEINTRQSATDAKIENLLLSVPEIISKINTRQSATDAKIENMFLSIPVSLREITRYVENMRNSSEYALKRIDSITDSTAYLLRRVEFVRRELMFEMRYGNSKPLTDGDNLNVKTQIISVDKLADFRKKGNIRLNLGCGHIPLDDYLNIDMRVLPSVDIVSEAENLPFEKGEVNEIFSSHLLEHFPAEQLRRELLPYWFSLLKPEGIFRAVVPDADGMINAYTGSEYSFEQIREVTFGGQDYSGDFHFNMFNSLYLSKLLSEAGFVKIEVVSANRVNGGCKEFEICARKPGAAS